MSSKHYNANYLEDTGNFLRELKEYSYSAFKSITSGKIIDLGCGTGMDVIGLAKSLGNDVKVLGIDHDQVMLDKGKESAKDMSNVGFLLSEANKIPFGDGSIAGIRAERLIQHLKDPGLVFTEIYRALQPGAPLVVVETDWPSLIFYNGYGEIEKKINHYLSTVKINNGRAARNLTSYLENYSFGNIQTEVFPFVLKSLADANTYLWTSTILQEMKQKGELSEEEYNLFVSSLERADANRYFACAINLVVVSATKN